MSAGEGQVFAGFFVPLALLRGLIAPIPLSLRATGRALRGRSDAARDTRRAAASWIRFLERDVLRTLRLLGRPRRPA